MASSAITNPISVLLVQDHQPTMQLCSEVLAEGCADLRTASTTEDALDVLERLPVDAVITALRIPQVGGIELLKIVRHRWPDVPVIVLTRYGTIESAIEATQLGASEYINFDSGALRVKLQDMVRRLHVLRYARNVDAQLAESSGLGGLVGTSPEMLTVYATLRKLGNRNYPVLIVGESGTGKELVARAIHFCGSRAGHAFVPVDCAALAPTLIESELFGYHRGAFTDARESRPGLFEAAQDGTLFLDEIGNLPLDLQPKLLRVLQERRVRPIGAVDERPISARVIAATNRDLEAGVREGRFRQDLYFRLNIVQIKIPPLRERRSDVPLLVRHFIEKFRAWRPDVTGVRPDAMVRLIDYDWPGNVRELENAIARAMCLSSVSSGPLLRTTDFVFSIQNGRKGASLSPDTCGSLSDLHRTAILHALEEADGDKAAAARMLGIGKTTVYRKLKEYRHSSRRSGSPVPADGLDKKGVGK